MRTKALLFTVSAILSAAASAQEDVVVVPFEIVVDQDHVFTVYESEDLGSGLLQITGNVHVDLATGYVMTLSDVSMLVQAVGTEKRAGGGLRRRRGLQSSGAEYTFVTGQEALANGVDTDMAVAEL